MTPYEQMAKLYSEHPQPWSFERYVDWYMKHAFLFSTREFFIMGRPILKGQQLGHHFQDWTIPENPDCWYIHGMAGDVAKVWSIMPFHLPWIAFHRLRGGKLELQLMPFDRLRRLANESQSVLAEA
jgi:hypothetical protein